MNSKHFRALILIFVLVLCCACLIACEKDNNDTTDNGSSIATTLSTPENVRVENGIVLWNAVGNATGYYVYINGRTFTTGYSSFVLSEAGLDAETYEISVRAFADGYEESSISEICRYQKGGSGGGETKQSCTLRVITQGGGSTNITEKTYDYNSIVDLIAYPKQSYHFDGWYSDTYYKVGLDRTFSFLINADTVLFAFFTKDIEETSGESSDDSQLMKCDEDFSIVVLCPEENGEEYIRGHLFVYDDYFLDDDGNVAQIRDKDGKLVPNPEVIAQRELGTIVDKGNNLYVVSPANKYEKSGAYLVKATENVSILKEYSRYMNNTGALNGAANGASTEDRELALVANDKGRDSLSFSVGNEKHENISLAEGVLVYSYTNNPNATNDNVDGWIMERIGKGLTDDETGEQGGFITKNINAIFGGRVTVETSEEAINERVIGKVIGFGGGITKDIEAKQFDDKTVFGKVRSWQYCGEEREYVPVFFIELEPVENINEIFVDFDVYDEGDIDLSGYVEANEEEIKETAMNAFCSSEDWINFVVSVEIAANEYAEENGYENPEPLNAANFEFDKPTVKRNGTEVSLSLGGTLTITFAEKSSSFGKSGGKITISFKFTETLKLEYSFSWLKKDVKILFWWVPITNGIHLTASLEQTSNFTFDIKFEYSAETKSGEAGQYRVNERSKKFHVPTCYHIRDVQTTAKNKSALELEKEGYVACLDCIHSKYVVDDVKCEVHKPGCWHLKQISYDDKYGTDMDEKTLREQGFTFCQLCSGSNQVKYFMNPNSHVVHVAGCKHLAGMTATTADTTSESLVNVINDGYTPCGTCLTDWQKRIEQEAEQEKFTAKLFKALDYADWGDQFKEIKDRVKGAMNPDTSKDFLLCEFPFTYIVTFWIKLYLNITFKVEATLHYEIETYNKFTLALHAAVGDGFHSSFAKEESGKSMEFTLVGRVEASIGLKLELGVSDPFGLIYVGVYGTVGMYADLSGIVHYSIKETTKNNGDNVPATTTHEEKYAAAYLEIGFYYDFGLSYRVLTLKGSLSLSKLFGLSGKVPLFAMGFNKVVYAYQNDITETLLLASEVKNEFTLDELNLMAVKTLSLPSMGSSKETLHLSPQEYDVNVTFTEQSGYLNWDANAYKFVVADNAPFGQTFEDTVTIVVKSADPWFRMWTWDEVRSKNTKRTICYLPTITVKLICANNCSEHNLLYLEREEPTCLETGLVECKMCMRCGKFFDVDATHEMESRTVIPVLGHDYVSIPAVEPGCMKTGLTEGTICQRCDYISVPQQIVDALGHKAGEEWVVEVEPTCEGQGRKYQGCERCGLAMNYTFILPHGHDVGDQELSCSDSVVCIVCNKVLAEKIEHDYHTTSMKAATCETNGWEVFTCSRCSDSKTEILYKTGHTKRQESANVWVSRESTCTESGEWSWRCDHENCDVEGGKICTETFNPDGHLYDEEYTVDVEPTCTTPGEKSIHCLKCGVKQGGSTVSLPALGHNADPATCTEDSVCARCGRTLRAALGHDYVLITPSNENALYRCSRCNDEVTHTHDYDITVVSPTCTAQGYTEHVCKDTFCLHYTYRSDFSIREHSWVESDRQEATCTVNGYVNYTCLYNDCDGTKHEVLTTGHIYDDDYTIDTPPTCTGKGSKSKHCAWYDTCGAKTDVTEIPATGHTLDREHATCTEDSTCTVCGQILEAAIGHNYQEVDGTREYVNYTALFRCVNCGDEKTEAFEHHFDDGEVVAPTCVAQGYTIYHCTDPGCTFEKKENYTAVVDHTYPQTGVRKNPTCTEDGYDTFTCTVCGHNDYRSYNGCQKYGHEWETIQRVESTCTRKGHTMHKYCALCGEVKVQQQELPLADHDFVKIGTHPATCLVDGYDEYKCSVCQTIQPEKTTSKHVESLTIVEASSPTCTEAGNIEYYYCANCYNLYEDAEAQVRITSSSKTVVAALGHNFGTDKKGYIDSTCTAYGYYYYECSRCQYKEEHTQEILPKGHDWVFNPAEPYEEATCTKIGHEQGYICTRCSETKGHEDKPALGHTYEVSVTDPTCVNQGYTTHTCSVCARKNELDREEGWQYVDSYTNAHNEEGKLPAVTKKDPGCTTEGYGRQIITYDNDNKPLYGYFDFYYCKTCEKYFKDDQAENEIPRNGIFISEVSTADDIRSIGFVSDVVVRPALGHQFDEWDEDNNRWGGSVMATDDKGNLLHDGNGALCTDYYVIHTCQRCQEHPTKVVYSYTNHELNAEGNCGHSNCSVSSKGLIYTFENDTYTVSGYDPKVPNSDVSDTTSHKYLYIPAEYDDGEHGIHPVTTVAYGAFKDRTDIVWVYISEKIESFTNNLGIGVFTGCTGLETIVVDENNMTYHNAGNCVIKTTDKELTIGCKNSIIPTDGSVTRIKPNAFSSGGLTSITIPESVTTIGILAFDELTSVYYMGDIASWCKMNFGLFFSSTSNPLHSAHNLYINNELITEIVIPNTISEIKVGAFDGWNGTRITIPDGVTSIGNSAFGGCTGLTSIAIPDSVTSIRAAFYNCTATIIWGDNPSITTIEGGSNFGGGTFYGYKGTSITIPNSVTSIGSYAFYGCTNLTNITFTGTVTQWMAISKDNKWITAGTDTIHCTDGFVVIDTSGNTIYARVEENDNANPTGNYLYFGTYPQSQVTNSTLNSTLTSMAGALPTESNNQKWTSYGYFINGSVTNFMWYIDLNYNGEKYRGVYFTSYRPHYTTSSSSTNEESMGNSYQDDNGYSTSTVYWFKYDPIKWRILSEANGEALILCEMIIDIQEYYPSSRTSTFSHNGGTGYANNYALSNIRKWLNDTFYNTAFTDLQKAIIQLTTVDNSARSTNPNNNATQWNSGNNTYACANTEDYIFLLSEQEVTNSAYGFNADYSNDDTVRRKKTTAYAKCQGAYTDTSSDYVGNGYWWLRSPGYSSSSSAWGVRFGGSAYRYGSVTDALLGVVPALRIRLS